MCGIFGFWAKESVPDSQIIWNLIRKAQERGQDGFGICVINKDMKVVSFRRIVGKMVDQTWIFPMLSKLLVGDLVLVSCRATPETEKETTVDMVQPISRNGLILTHNGGVTESSCIPFLSERLTKIDSEVILLQYMEKQYNMKQTMETISGSFAFIMLDQRKRKLYTVCSFNPLAHMYVRGVGYFLHSDLTALEDALWKMTSTRSDGMNVWENWYHHYIDGYTIIETDLDSGFQFKQKFNPLFLHPKSDKLPVSVYNPTPVLVCASGGVDSAVTAYILKHAGYDIRLVHFLYGAKAQNAEAWAVSKLANDLRIQCYYFNLQTIYEDMAPPSMLLNKEIPITSGGKDLKSTIAWVAGRNMIFASIIMSLAESLILQSDFNKVCIAAGWNQLSEETGGYPDNSFHFQRCLDDIKNFGLIKGNQIEFLPVLRNLTKTETWKLGKHFDVPFHFTVSCDDPKMSLNTGTPVLCSNCGSTKLSMIAADRAGVADYRCIDGIIGRTPIAKKVQLPHVFDLTERLIIPTAAKERLHSWQG